MWQTGCRTRTQYHLGMNSTGVPLHVYPSVPAFPQKIKKKKFQYRSGTGWVQAGLKLSQTVSFLG